MFKKRLIELKKALDELDITTGRTFYVMNKTDEGYDDFVEDHGEYLDGVERVYNSAEDGYAAMVSNRNDVLKFAAHGNHNLTAMMTVAKNRCRFEGMDVGGRLATQGSKIILPVTTVATDIAAVLVTGVRNSFRNLKIYSNNTKDESLSAFIDNGEGTLIEYCNIAKLAGLDDAGWCHFWMAGDSLTMKHTHIGASNVQNSAAGYGIKIDAKSGGGSDKCKNCFLEDCYVEMQVKGTVKATSFLIKIVDNAAMYFNNIMKNCVFSNFDNSSNNGDKMTDAVSGAASTTAGELILINPSFPGCTGVGGGTGTGIRIVNSGGAADANGGLDAELTD